MIEIFRSFLKALFGIVLIISLVSCSGGGSSGLEPFQSSDGRYGFLFPTGWTKVSISEGPEVVFHDLINSDEMLSLVVSKLNNSISLEDLGTPTDVAKRLLTDKNNQDDFAGDIQLIDAQERESSGHTFYDFEYSISINDRNRHELATLSVDRGYLYTFSASSSDIRWIKVKDLYGRVIHSFTFLI